MLHLYTGGGKGKTTSAMGLALRMAGHGKKVLVCQFLKDGTSGELEALSQMRTVTVWASGGMQGFYSKMGMADQARVREDMKKQVEGIREAMGLLTPDLIVLDELAEAMALGCVSEQDGMRLITDAMQYGEVAVTGREAPEVISDMADYVTEMRCIRHPYAKGTGAREGIEY